MVTTQQRDATIQAHVQALTKLGLTYQREANLFLQRAKQEPASSLPNFLSTYLPQFNQPFQAASSLIGRRFMGIRSEQSGYGGVLPRVNEDVERMKHQEASRRLEALMETLIQKQREGLRATDQTIVKAMERPLVEADRGVVLYLGEEMDEVKKTVVGVRFDGCDFCKSLSVQGVTGSGGKANFHNACRCVFDPSFKGDPNYSQGFHAEFKESYKKAQEAIRSGELEPRIIQVRSKEWEAQMRRDVANKVRQERKIWEEDWTPTSEERTLRRKQDSELVDSIISKAMEGKPLNSVEKGILEDGSLVDPFDTARLYEPIHRPWRDTERDTIKLMQSQRASEIYKLEKSLNA